MEPEEERDYRGITAIAAELGFREATDRSGAMKAGFYRYKDTHAEVDLTACDSSLEAVIKTAFDQLAEQIDNAYHYGIESDLNS